MRKQVTVLRRQSDFCRHDQTHAEVSSSVGDKEFRIGLIPLTRMVTLNGKRGSFMLWQQNMIDAEKFIPNENPTKHELRLFQLMTIYDVLFGNLDRHLQNWLVKLLTRISSNTFR